MKEEDKQHIEVWLKEIFRIVKIQDECVQKLQLRNALWKIMEFKGRKDAFVKFYSIMCFNNNLKGRRHHVYRMEETIQLILDNKNSLEEVLRIVCFHCFLIKVTKDEHKSFDKNGNILDVIKKICLVDKEGKKIKRLHTFNIDIYKIGLNILEK